MKVIIHRDIETLKRLLPTWKRLNEEYNDITIFQTKHWLENWWQVKNKEKMTPYIIEVVNDRQTIGILPLCISYNMFLDKVFRTLKPIGWDNSDYLLPVLSRAFPWRETMYHAFNTIFEDCASWDYFEWSDIPKDGAIDKYLESFLNQRGAVFKRIDGAVCPYIPLNTNTEDIRNQSEQAFLKQIRSKERRLMKKGSLTFKKVVNEADIAFVMTKLFDLHCRRWEHTDTPSSFLKDEEREVALLNATALFQQHVLHLTYLLFNNDVIAVHFGMSDDKRLYYYLPAYDTDYRKYSVGNILTSHLIQHAAKEGYEIFDFLKGDEGYKWMFGAKEKKNITFSIYNQTLRSKINKNIAETYFSTQFKKKNLMYQFLKKLKVRGSLSTLGFIEILSKQ